MATATETADDVVVDLRDAAASLATFSGPEAAELAGITYRQLDYWARRRWVVPSAVALDGAGRRAYSLADVVRLAALGHLGRSHVDVATYAEATGRLPVGAGAGDVVVWGIHDDSVRLVPARALRREVGEPGRWVVFDPAAVVRAVGQRRAPGAERRPRRRTFSADYKLRILAEYDRLTEPGAKGTLLRREGLHTSHLVAWRRGRAAGDLWPRRPAGRSPAAAGAARPA